MSSTTASSESITSSSVPAPSSELPDKVIIWFRPVGSAPILKQSKFRISIHQSFQAIIDFLRKQLYKIDRSEPLFLYVNSSFAPAPDESLSNLFRCFAVDGMLIINYSVTAAWG